MSLLSLLSLQGILFILMLVGAFLKKKGIITDAGKKCLSDLCIYAVIPCNIFKSCLIDADSGILRSCALLLVSAVIMQVICLIVNRFAFNRYPEQQKKVLQYCTIVPMSGFLGNPIAEGLYDALGILYTSVFLIPMRVIMWSVGPGYFVKDARTEPKKVLKNVLTHPCLVAIYLGLACMLLKVRLPDLILSPVKYIGSCNTALTMFIVGTILADVELPSIFSGKAFAFCALRLVLLPAIAFGLGLLLGLDNVSHGVSVIMTGMPAGATAAIFAAKYGSDEKFATRCIVLSTLLSMLTLPLWALAVG